MHRTRRQNTCVLCHVDIFCVRLLLILIHHTHCHMGNIFKNNTATQNHAPHQTPDPKAYLSWKPNVFLPIGEDMNQSSECRIIFRARHTAQDYVATIEAHKDHTIAQLKRRLIEFMGIPFPSEDGRCKIFAVWNKFDLRPDEPIKDEITKDKPKINDRYLGGSIDHLTLGEYGLDNGDYFTFLVIFPQLFQVSTRT